MAFFGSVLLHGIALLFFALVVASRPPAPPEPSSEEPPPLEIALALPSDTPQPVPEPEAIPTPTPKSRQVIDATGVDADSTPLPNSALSDRTTRASSADQNDGAPPGAKQAGRKMASFQFDPRPPATGVVARAVPPAPTPPQETAPALPQPDRFVHRPAASPATPEATPSLAAAPDEFAMVMATPTPTPEDPFDPSVRSTSPPLPKPADRPAARGTPVPPVGATRSAENGSSPTRGPGAMDTLATPSGRYTRQVADMIRFVWQRASESRGDETYGRTVIHLTVDREGLVISPRIATNTADSLFASAALQAVVVARLPPMPAEVVTELEGKRLPIDITFERTPMPQEAALH